MSTTPPVTCPPFILMQVAQCFEKYCNRVSKGVCEQDSGVYKLGIGKKLYILVFSIFSLKFSVSLNKEHGQQTRAVLTVPVSLSPEQVTDIFISPGFAGMSKYLLRFFKIIVVMRLAAISHQYIFLKAHCKFCFIQYFDHCNLIELAALVIQHIFLCI